MKTPERPCEAAPNSNKRYLRPEVEAGIREAALDETIAETFPASDPPSSIPNPGFGRDLAQREGQNGMNAGKV
jgi:hypothetical protein